MSDFEEDDKIDLTNIAGIEGLDDVLAAAGETATGVTFTFDEGTLSLDGIFGSNLDAENFIL